MIYLFNTGKSHLWINDETNVKEACNEITTHQDNSLLGSSIGLLRSNSISEYITHHLMY